ncbi:serine/threonine-protein kinase [Sphingomonas sp. UNC305MFCol5.2]|uniref:serine/threonine-protein kinase n=1 Tax=Sphingomonas sp. UNC305MFCol5.2 TaxID=1449076 RepID=UPI0004A71EC2|nr:serine/threonine-protein kinase [Sphingomonas sp. UNC305MFCol5.2]
MRQPTSSEWATIRDAFDRLVEKSEGREEALDAMALDPFVRERVRAMLEAHGRSGLFESTSADRAPAPVEYSSLNAGDSVGAFRIVRLIGRGGTGEVYFAERSGAGFAQHVALKLLRPEATERLAQFDAERRMLAGLEHPGIARLIDGGVARDGRPYIALEYVEGEPITTWCAGRHARIEERLRLMLEVCDAVSYAHSRLIVHRDLKPANIMVDDGGRVRLLDFGIAKILDEAAPGQTLTQAMLTPDYAAPEQFRRDQATVATDVYALGGVLYELLAGEGAWRRPGGTSSSELTRMINDEPEPPSRAAVRQGRSPVPASRIAGDLDAIVLKAMRHEPATRYASVATLADDIRRHLRFEPVQARRGTFGYQLRRFVRRHRGATAAAAAIMLALIAGAGAFAFQAHRVAAERDLARAQARKAEAVNEAVSLMFRNAQDFGKGGSESAKELLNDSAARLIQSFGRHSPETAPVVVALAELYLQVNDIVGAQTLLATALEKGVGNDDPAAKARLEMTLGTVEGATGKLDEATRLLDNADAIFASDPDRYRKERLESGAARAQILRQRGRRDEAIAILNRQLPEAEAEYAGDPRKLLIRYNNLGVHLVEASRLDELDAILKRGERVVVRFGQERTPMAISLLQLRGGWYARKDDHPAALATFEKAAELRRALYGPSMALSADLLQVGRTRLGLGQVDKAMPILVEAHDMAVQFAGATAPVTLMTAMTLAEGYAHQREPARAQALLASAEPGLKPLGTKGILYGVYLRARSQVDQAQGRFDEAARDLDAAEVLFRTLGAPADPFTRSIPGLRSALARARADGS